MKEKLHLCARILAGLLCLALIYATAVPLTHSNAWWVRLFDFPRIQIAVLIGLTLLIYVALNAWRRLHKAEYGLATLLVLALLWQLLSIAPYTAVYPAEMAGSRADDNGNRVSLLVYNVLASNREVEPLRELISDTDPDIILLLEPDQWWLEQLAGLEQAYLYTILQPQENEYGILLYSRLELVDPEVRFLVQPEVPSLRTQVRLGSGALVTLYGLHPRPPGIKAPEGDEDERVDSGMRDAELMLVAEEVARLESEPVIVAGDFNDVAWSQTTHLFQRVGGLLDPRVGRGLFNTFDTRSRILRYPLDHAFASGHFRVSELRRLPAIGSDHFPLLVALDYNPDGAAGNDEPEPEAGDAEQADEAIEEGVEEEGGRRWRQPVSTRAFALSGFIS